MESIWINTALRGAFAQKFKRANRRAEKLGLAPITVRFGETVERDANRDTIASYVRVDENGKRRRVALYTEALLEGEAPRVEGYELVAVVDLRGEKPMVRRHPGAPEGVDLRPFLHSDGHCDHCDTRRARNDVLVLREVATGDLIQIGRNCAADFFRSADVASMVQVSDWAELRGWTDGSVGAKAEPYSSVERMYQVAAAVVRTFGWLSHKDAMYTDMMSTRARVWQNLFPLPSHKSKFPEDYPEVTEADEAEAKLVMEWLRRRFLDKDEADCTEFEMNVRAACEGTSEMPLVRDRNLNYLIWGIAGYQRDLQREAQEKARQRERDKRAKENAKSVHVGEVGGRVELNVTLVSKRAFSGQYGPRYLCHFTDESGNVIVWWGTNDFAAEIEPGLKCRLRATIKAHDIYEGVNQTVITRAAEMAST